MGLRILDGKPSIFEYTSISAAFLLCMLSNLKNKLVNYRGPCVESNFLVKCVLVTDWLEGPFSTFTFRFPRVEKIREDKDCNDCMTITDLEALKARGMAKSYLYDDDDDDKNGDSIQQQTKRRKIINVKHASVDPIYQPFWKRHPNGTEQYKSWQIKAASKNLSGKVFVVEVWKFCNFFPFHFFIFQIFFQG